MVSCGLRRLNHERGPSTEAHDPSRGRRDRVVVASRPDRERPAAPLIAKRVVAKTQQPMGYCHLGKLGPILLTAANLDKELAQLLVLERVPGGRLNQDPDPHDEPI
jgi:hypothetical protein